MVEVKVGKYLSVENMNDIYDNIDEINKLLQSKLKFSPETLKDSSVTRSISPLDILDKMNAVEYNIRVIHSKLNSIKNLKDENFKAFVWQPITFDKGKEVKRWIMWIKDCFDTLNNKKVNISYSKLLTSNGTPILSSNGNQIYYIKRSV